MKSINFIGLFILLWTFLLSLIFFISKEQKRKIACYSLVFFALLLLIIFYHILYPSQRLLLSTVGLLYIIKTIILLRHSQQDIRQFSKIGILIYMSFWPGMDPEALRKRQYSPFNGHAFLRGCLLLIGGALLGIIVLYFHQGMGTVITGWAGLAALIFMIHFGFSEILTSALQASGWAVNPLFKRPFQSRSLRDFWSVRWNTAFVEMDKILFFPLLKKYLSTPVAVLGVFLISGFLHELGISYAAGAHWGLPTLYFLLHGVIMTFEDRWIRFEKNGSLFFCGLWVWGWILIPLPLLFHHTFREVFINNLVKWLSSLLKIS